MLRLPRPRRYALSLGDFTGGALAVECSAREVAVVETKGRLAKIDGRFPHWVEPYMGERYSIIWFRTEGVAERPTQAVFDAGGGMALGGPAVGSAARSDAAPSSAGPMAESNEVVAR